ncbi:cupin domain-containing protein [Mucilaginibacter sabulilitoris]|uniref:Cupin domain-containing protein n=1 Tax=Mucilaginibacter sabulilitoris TaxID=1173583 RepID=A0ABZ0TII8_9SPHI|nr:cupin domain-containing protein [Mucilaginibacter sabulilitoris]WPU92772.1 cupin domain-containing protein [Mucilaginibacter sabulilitoris]
MERQTFLSWLGLLAINMRKPFDTDQTMKPEQLLFQDDGIIPNSEFPLLLYRSAFTAREDAGAAWLENHFAGNNWTNSWRNGVYPFHHYHSTSHEVLGVYQGTALLHLGGEKGKKVKVEAGDIIVIPAGVGHKNLGSDNLGIVGAYEDGRSWDVNKGLPGERPKTDETIAALPIPKTDPFTGKTGGLINLWKKH